MADGDCYTDYEGRDALAVRFSGVARSANYQHQDQREEELHAESLHRHDPVGKLHHAQEILHRVGRKGPQDRWTRDSARALRHNVQNTPDNWYLWPRIRILLPQLIDGKYLDKKRKWNRYQINKLHSYFGSIQFLIIRIYES